MGRGLRLPEKEICLIMQEAGSLIIKRTPTLYDFTKLLRDKKLLNDYLLLKYQNSNHLVLTFRKLLRLWGSQQAKLTKQLTNKN